jgi:RHS repeat-associated protein
MSDSGQPGSAAYYDPWGQVESGSVPPFGFTGELQNTSTDLVYLRARWYHAAQGTFMTRDPFVGSSDQPYSLHLYQYAQVLGRFVQFSLMPALLAGIAAFRTSNQFLAWYKTELYSIPK